VAAARPVGDDVQSRGRVESAGVDLLARVGTAAHERVDLDAALGKRLAGPWGGDDHPRLAPPAQRRAVPRGEVHGVDAGELLPGQLVASVRGVPRADDGDRALAVGVQVGEGEALGLRAPGGVHRHAELFEPAQRRPPVVVVPEGREEGRLAGEAQELHRRHGTAAAGVLPGRRRVQDLSGARDARDLGEANPLGVADDRDAHAGILPASGDEGSGAGSGERLVDRETLGAARAVAGRSRQQPQLAREALGRGQVYRLAQVDAQ
jgi:hypothetical protein